MSESLNFQSEAGRSVPLFHEILFFDDAQPRSAALNMAMDEALLKAGLPLPLLRSYRWRHPALSLGYFSRYGDLPQGDGREVVRRWTGGGIVRHGDDFTYSLVAGPREEVARAMPVEAYRAVHSILAGVLGRGAGLEPVPAAGAPSAAPGECFRRPVGFDVVIGGKKVAGGAQRRTRWGLLHQGSVQAAGLPADFPGKWAGALAGKVRRFSVDAGLLAEAESLARTRYANPDWTRKF